MALIETLAEQGRPVALPAVLAAAMSRTGAIRLAALDALSVLGDTTTVPFLAQTAALDDGETGAAARKSLDRLGGSDVELAIVAELKNAPAEVKCELLGTLGRRNLSPPVRTRKVLPAMLAAAEDEDAGVRVAALRHLKDLAEPCHLEGLTKLVIRGKTWDEKRAAEEALLAVAANVKDEDERSLAVRKALAGARDSEVRLCLYSALGRMGGEPAYRTLREAVKSNDGDNRSMALIALGGWPDDGPVGDLFALARKAPTQDDRDQALTSAVILSARAYSGAVKAVERLQGAMKIARTDDQKRMILDLLGEVECPEALAWSLSCVKDPVLGKSAKQAVLTLSASQVKYHPGKARAAVREIEALDPSDEAKKKIAAILDEAKKYGDYLTVWKAAGPYAMKGKGMDKLHDQVFPPEEGAKDVVWRPIPVGTNSGKPFLVELDRFFGGSDRCGYLTCEVYSPTARTVRAELGSDDGVKVWINGEVAHSNNAARGNTPRLGRLRGIPESRLEPGARQGHPGRGRVVALPEVP